MTKLDPLRPRQPDSIDDARVILVVGKDKIMPLNERGQDAEICCVTASEVQRSFGFLEVGEAPFDFGETLSISPQQPGCGRAAAFAQNSLRHSFFQ